jgi:hypothetical protein
MDFAYDLGGSGVAMLKKYQVAASNTVVGRPYLKVADAGTGIVLGTTTGAADFIGVNIDAAGTYVTGQQSDNSDTQRLTTIIVNPLAVFRARLSGGATDGTALAEHTVTSASTDGLTVTHAAFNASSPEMDEGVVWGYRGNNAGKARKITSTSSTATTVIVAFPYDIAVGDTFLHAPIYPTRSITAQLTTNCTEIDASAAISGDATIVVVEHILLDAAGNGATESYALIQFADHLFGATVT